MSLSVVSILVIILIQTAVINYASAQPVHPTSIINNTEYYNASAGQAFADKTIICNYYNTTNQSQPRNCQILCNDDMGCMDTDINCNGAPYCSINCSSPQSCLNNYIDASTSLNLSISCSNNNTSPCQFITVQGPIINNSTASILCDGEYSCAEGHFDLSNTTNSSIICQQVDHDGENSGATCFGASFVGNQNTKILCAGNRVCLEANITLIHQKSIMTTNKEWSIECLSNVESKQVASCARMKLDAVEIEQFKLSCQGHTACAETQIILSPQKEANNTIICNATQTAQYDNTCRLMQIYTKPEYELGWLNLSCIRNDKVCHLLQTHCYNETEWVINYKNYTFSWYKPINSICNPIDPRITFNKWPLLNFTNTPSSVINSTNHTIAALFYALEPHNIYKYQFTQIECEPQYDECSLWCNAFGSCQGVYVPFSNDNITRDVIGIACDAHGCLNAQFEVNNTNTFIHQCHGHWSCYQSTFIMENIRNAVNFECSGDAFDDEDYYYPHWTCFGVNIEANNVNTELTLTCDNTFNPKGESCTNITLNAPYHRNINIKCHGNYSCNYNTYNLYKSYNIFIDCDTTMSSDLFAACINSKYYISEQAGNNTIFNCYGSTEYNVKIPTCQNSIIYESFGKNTFTQINCIGTLACQFSSVSMPDDISMEKAMVNFATFEVNCEYTGACNMFDLALKHPGIDIDCTKNSGIYGACYSMLISLLGDNSTLNIDCDAYITCRNSWIFAETDDNYINLNCGNSVETSPYACIYMSLQVSGLSRHTNIGCGDCEYMNIAVPWNYTDDDFLSMTCLTYGNCKYNHINYNIDNLNIYCYGLGDNNNFCKNGYKTPLIRGKIKPTVVNTTGEYYIADKISTTVPYVFGFAQIECNSSIPGGCFIECNANQSCYQSVIKGNKYNNNVSLKCSTPYSCTRANVVDLNYSNLYWECDAKHSCETVYINVSNINNTLLSFGTLSTSQWYAYQEIYIENSSNLTIECIYTDIDNIYPGIACNYMKVNTTNITTVNIIGDGGISDSLFDVNGTEQFEFQVNENKQIGNQLSSNNLFELYDIDSVDIDCNQGGICNDIVFNIYNESDVILTFGKEEEFNSIWSAAQYVKVKAPNANSMDIKIFAAIADSKIEGPQYMMINGTNQTKSNIYCENYGCNELMLLSKNGVSDWNITFGDICSPMYPIVEWGFYCGRNLTEKSIWEGDSYCDNSFCCDAMIANLSKDLDDKLGVCGNNGGGSNKPKVNIYVIIGSVTGCLILICAVIGGYIIMKRRKYGNNINSTYSTIK